MERYLSHQTQVKVFVGIKVFNDPLNRRVPMGVFIRQINPPAPSPALPGPLLPPRPVCVGQLAYPHHDLLTTPQNWQWIIPIDVLFFLNPPSVSAEFTFPQQGLVLDVDLQSPPTCISHLQLDTFFKIEYRPIRHTGFYSSLHLIVASLIARQNGEVSGDRDDGDRVGEPRTEI